VPWTRILWHCSITHTTYDPSKHGRAAELTVTG
jgi:hypothetical protein